MSKYRTWREYLIKRLSSHPERAGGYLQTAFEEYQIHRDPAVFQLALQTVVESRGGITELSKKIEMSSQSISEILNGKELPRIEILTAILNALGCQISIQPIDSCERMFENITIDSVHSTANNQL